MRSACQSGQTPFAPMQLKEQGHVSWECQSELFRQEVEGADDIRLNAPLISKCLGDKRKFCKDVAPGT